MASVDVSEQAMAERVVRFKDMPPRPKPVPPGTPQEVTDFMTADENYSYLAPAMEQQSIIQKYAALTGGDAGTLKAEISWECQS